MTGDGERDGDREAMDRVVGRMVRSGVPADKAEHDARESMRRVDRQKRERGQR